MGVGSWIASWVIGGGAKVAADTVMSIASPFVKIWADNKKALIDERVVSVKAATEITTAGFNADVRVAELQQSLDLADRTHWSTRWIRPAFCALAFVWMAGSVYQWLVNGVTLDDVVRYLLAGIVASIFLLRPYEKNKRADIVAKTAAAK